MRSTDEGNLKNATVFAVQGQTWEVMVKESIDKQVTGKHHLSQ
jgi:hypothetical protein